MKGKLDIVTTFLVNLECSLLRLGFCLISPVFCLTAFTLSRTVGGSMEALGKLTEADMRFLFVT